MFSTFNLDIKLRLESLFGRKIPSFQNIWTQFNFVFFFLVVFFNFIPLLLFQRVSFFNLQTKASSNSGFIAERKPMKSLSQINRTKSNTINFKLIKHIITKHPIYLYMPSLSLSLEIFHSQNHQIRERKFWDFFEIVKTIKKWGFGNKKSSS